MTITPASSPTNNGVVVGNVPTDSGGRYFYSTEGKDNMSPTYKPLKRELESIECRHRLGY